MPVGEAWAGGAQSLISLEASLSNAGGISEITSKQRSIGGAKLAGSKIAENRRGIL